MKKFLKSFAFIGFGIAVATTSAAESNYGVGFVVGSPTALSAKVSLGATNAANFLLGYDLYSNKADHHDGALYLGGDYVWYNYNLIPVAKGKLPIYYGPGLNATISANSSLGIRAVVGLEYQFADIPFDAFVEIGPGITVVPSTEPNVSGGLGVRYLF